MPAPGIDDSIQELSPALNPPSSVDAPTFSCYRGIVRLAWVSNSSSHSHPASLTQHSGLADLLLSTPPFLPIEIAQHIFTSQSSSGWGTMRRAPPQPNQNFASVARAAVLSDDSPTVFAEGFYSPSLSTYGDVQQGLPWRSVRSVLL